MGAELKTDEWNDYELITDAMMKAGTLEYARGNLDFESEEEIVAKIYHAMVKARRHSSDPNSESVL